MNWARLQAQAAALMASTQRHENRGMAGITLQARSQAVPAGAFVAAAPPQSACCGGPATPRGTAGTPAAGAPAGGAPAAAPAASPAAARPTAAPACPGRTASAAAAAAAGVAPPPSLHRGPAPRMQITACCAHQGRHFTAYLQEAWHAVRSMCHVKKMNMPHAAPLQPS